MGKPHKWAEVIKAAADGQTIQFRDSIGDEWIDYEPEHAFATFAWEFGEFRIKPLAPKWPETTMTEYDLLGHCTNARAEDNALAIANAAIAHALETGQVTLPNNGFVNTVKGSGPSGAGSSGFMGVCCDYIDKP